MFQTRKSVYLNGVRVLRKVRKGKRMQRDGKIQDTNESYERRLRKERVKYLLEHGEFIPPAFR